MVETPRPRGWSARFGAQLLALALFAPALPALALEPAAAPASALDAPLGRPDGAAIASANAQATDAGLAVLARGGNAFDAAVAVSAALGLVEPESSGLGGGGFFLLRRASDGKTVFIDARERAPLASTRDMFLDPATGEPRPRATVDGPLAAGIPGLPAALVSWPKTTAGCRWPIRWPPPSGLPSAAGASATRTWR